VSSVPLLEKSSLAAQNEQTRVRIALVLIWFIPLLWTVNGVIARTAPGVVSPHVLALARWGIAGALLAGIARTELWNQRRVVWAHAGRYLVLGACGMWICGAWVYLAGQSTEMVNIALIYASSPVLIALGSVLWMGEPFTWRQLAGALLAMAGVVHVVVQGEWLRLAQVVLVPGDLWVVGASVAWAAYALLQRHWPSPLGSSAHLAAICAGGVVVLVPFAAWELLQPATPAIGPQAVGMMVLAALVPGLGAYWIYGWTQKVLGAGRVAMTLYLGPLYSALVSWLALGEQLGWHHAVGAVLILSGVGLVVAIARPPAE